MAWLQQTGNVTRSTPAGWVQEKTFSSANTVSNTLTAQWNVVAAVAQTGTLQWHLNVAVEQTLTPQWHAVTAVEQTATFQWNAVTAVSQTLTPQWDLDAQTGPIINNVDIDNIIFHGQGNVEINGSGFGTAGTVDIYDEAGNDVFQTGLTWTSTKVTVTTLNASGLSGTCRLRLRKTA